MPLLAVMIGCGVTQGAGHGVPISGAMMGHLTGQVTSPASLAPGAGQSEPHGGVWPPCRTCCAACRPCRRVLGAGCTRVTGGARGGTKDARNTGGNECIYGGIPYGRPVQAGAGTVPVTGQGQCQYSAKNSAITRTQHPSPVTRHPSPVTTHPAPTTSNVPRVLSY